MISLKQTDFPELKTTHLQLVRPSLEYASDYHRILSCPEVSRYSDVPHQPTAKRSERFVSWMSKLHTRKRGIAWLIKTPDDQTCIGAIRINSIEKKAACGIVGYELHPDYWGKGYASEALAALVEYAHGTMDLNRLEAWTTHSNPTSEKVLLNNGFLYEGMQREKLAFRGKRWDIRLYGRLKGDSMKP